MKVNKHLTAINKTYLIEFGSVWRSLKLYYSIQISTKLKQKKMVEKVDDRLLPEKKIRTIMKSCGDPNALLSKESILVVTKAAVSKIAFLFFLSQ